MAGKNKPRKNHSENGATLGFEAQLWAAADKMRGHIDVAEYKHVVLGLIFLKYISDAFLEKRNEYLAANVFWLPPNPLEMRMIYIFSPFFRLHNSPSPHIADNSRDHLHANPIPADAMRNLLLPHLLWAQITLDET
jgi:hypothetical protein